MSSSLPEGVVLEHPRPEDAPRVLATLCAFDKHYLGESEWMLDELEADWRETDLAGDVWTAVDGEQVVGYVSLSERGGDWEFDGYVHPARFGEGIGGALVDLAESEARERGSRMIRTGVLGADEAAHQLLADRGFEVVRGFYRMRITLDERPAPPSWPEGLRETPVDLDADLEAVHAALDDGFSEHWNINPVAYDEWARRQRERGRLDDPSMWIVVRDGDEIAGLASLERERFGAGWVGRLTVRTPWRRRGLGEAILLEAFGRLWDSGQRVVALGVDAQNETGATRLYERAGMKLHWSATVLEKAP
jgi:mycothiol synthase